MPQCALATAPRTASGTSAGIRSATHHQKRSLSAMALFAASAAIPGGRGRRSPLHTVAAVALPTDPARVAGHARATPTGGGRQLPAARQWLGCGSTAGTTPAGNVYALGLGQLARPRTRHRKADIHSCSRGTGATLSCTLAQLQLPARGYRCVLIPDPPATACAPRRAPPRPADTMLCKPCQGKHSRPTSTPEFGQTFPQAPGGGGHVARQ